MCVCIYIYRSLPLSLSFSLSVNIYIKRERAKDRDRYIYIYIYILLKKTNKIAEGFQFMPLSLVRLRTFRLSHMDWLGVTLKQVLTRVRAGGWRCHSDVIIVRDEMGWQGAGDVTHRKRAEVCVRIWRKKECGTRRQTRRIDFWSSQAWGECAPYGGRTRWGPTE